MFDNDWESAREVAHLIGVGRGEAPTFPHIGTRALMLAVLEDGIRVYLSGGRAARYEAELWVHGRREGAAFSFSVICETLGLEPSSVRLALTRLREQRTAPRGVARSRPYVRRAAGLRRRRRRVD